VVYVDNPALGLWDAQEAGDVVRFELEQVFGADTEPAEAILSGIWRQALDTDEEGNVYILDASERLVSFAPNGSVRWSRGGPGQGPGEFDGAEGIAWNGASTIYVTNGNGSRIDSWSAAGEFLGSRSISHLAVSRGTLVGVLDEHTVVLQADGTASAGVRVGVLDLRGEGSTIADFDVDVASGSSDVGASMEVEIVNGSIAVGDWDSYDLRFYGRTGEPERIVSREFDRMVEPVPYEEWQANNGIAPFSWLKPPLPLGDGTMMAIATWTDPEEIERVRARKDEAPTIETRMSTMRSSFDLFDPDGRYLTSVEIESGYPEMGIPDEVDVNGRIYTTVMEPFPHARRYRIVVGGS
jgi:hypothetical protein